MQQGQSTDADYPSGSTLAEYRALCWTQGIVASWYLRPSQLEVYNLLCAHKNPFVEAARRFGKTTTILAYVLEQLRLHPGWVARWCEPWKEQAREIVIPEIDKLQRECPRHLRFKFQVSGSVYIGPGNSRIYLRGVNEDRGESARGPASNIIVADEFGSWRHPEYAVNEVLRPQLLTTDGQFIFASSPSEDLSHQYYTDMERAKREGRFIQKIIFDNESLTPEKIQETILEVGGEHTPAWRREYLCEAVSDPENLVVGEYTEERNDVADDMERPEFFDAYVGGDSGVDDNTVILFGYHDYYKDLTVIEDELVLNGKTSRIISDQAKEREKAHWGTDPCQCSNGWMSVGPRICQQGHGLQPYSRVYDANKQIIYDMGSEYKYWVQLPEKADKDAALLAFKERIRLGKVKIKKRCEILRRQLKVGRWATDKHLDFHRSKDPGLKHLDAIAAAIYLNRSINPRRNPFPQNVGVTKYSHHVFGSTPQGKEEQALATIFSMPEGFDVERQ